MQRATLLLHTMEHMVFPAAIFTREIKSSTIAFAETIMGLHVSISSLEKLLKSYFEVQRSEDGKDRSICIQIEEVGQCGSKYEAHAVINSQYTNQPNLPT